jgi:hypothetical protein
MKPTEEIVKSFKWAKENILKTIALTGVLGTICTFLVTVYGHYENVKMIPAHVKAFETTIDSLKAEIAFERLRNNVLMDVVKEELDVNKWNKNIEHTNKGDSWYFTVEYYGKDIVDEHGKPVPKGKVVYAAIFKQKDRKYGYFDFFHKYHIVPKKE